MSLPAELSTSHRFLTWDELAGLADRGGMALGSHGLSHLDLTCLDDTVLTREMVDSRRQIESHTGLLPVVFSYPDGRHDARVRRAARLQYSAAFALIPQAREGDPMQLPRLPGLPGGVAALRRMLHPTYSARLALWRWRARRGWA